MQNPEFQMHLQRKHTPRRNLSLKYSLKCTMNGYPDNDRCKFWAQIYMLQAGSGGIKMTDTYAEQILKMLDSAIN